MVTERPAKTSPLTGLVGSNPIASAYARCGELRRTQSAIIGLINSKYK